MSTSRYRLRCNSKQSAYARATADVRGARPASSSSSVVVAALLASAHQGPPDSSKHSAPKKSPAPRRATGDTIDRGTAAIGAGACWGGARRCFCRARKLEPLNRCESLVMEPCRGSDSIVAEESQDCTLTIDALRGGGCVSDDATEMRDAVEALRCGDGICSSSSPPLR